MDRLEVGGFLLSFWGLNRPENSSSFPPPWGRGRHVRSQRVGVSQISIENLPMSHTKKPVPFPQKRPEKTTSSHQGLSSNYDFLQSSYSNSFQHSMTPQRRKWHGRDATKTLLTSACLVRRVLVYCSNWINMFWLLFGEEAVCFFLLEGSDSCVFGWKSCHWLWFWLHLRVLDVSFTIAE